MRWQSNLHDSMKRLFEDLVPTAAIKTTDERVFWRTFGCHIDNRYPFAVYSSKEYVLIICLAHPLGIECSVEAITSPCIMINWKCSREFGREWRIGRGLVQQSSVAASISPALFFISFFWASKRKKIANTAMRCIFRLELEVWVFSPAWRKIRRWNNL